MTKNYQKYFNSNVLTTIGLTLYLTSLSAGVFADDATEGTKIITNSLKTLKDLLLGDARVAIDSCIVTAGAGGAIMAKSWGPVAMSAVGVLGYELLCASIGK